MRSRDVLTYAYEQVEETFTSTVEGLGPDDLARRVQPGANPIGWLAWHLLRVQDDHVADVAGTEQVWTAEDWVGRFGLPVARSEERRVGKECRSRWSPYH